VRECSTLLLNIVLQENVIDTWRWLLHHSHRYTVREAYNFITNNGNSVDKSTVVDVWHKFIPSKVSLFVWRLLRNRLSTRDNLVRRRVLLISDSVCVSSCGEPETAAHLFFGCNTFILLWSHVLYWMGLSAVLPGDSRQHLLQFTNMAGLPRATYSFLIIIWFATVWAIWKEINNRVFQNTACDYSSMAEIVKLNSFLWLKSSQTSFNNSYHDW
jgi:hypothetical protein